jgi:hypothetical protein
MPSTLMTVITSSTKPTLSTESSGVLADIEGLGDGRCTLR